MMAQCSYIGFCKQRSFRLNVILQMVRATCVGPSQRESARGMGSTNLLFWLINASFARHHGSKASAGFLLPNVTALLCATVTDILRERWHRARDMLERLPAIVARAGAASS